MEGRGGELDGLEALVGYALRRARSAVGRSFASLFGDLHVRQTQLGVMTVVEKAPGIMPSRVGSLLGIKRANVGPLLESLEARGLLHRRPSSADRRSQALFLTEAGATLLAELHRREVEHEALIAATLSAEERTQLLTLLRRVEEAALAAAAGDNQNEAA